MTALEEERDEAVRRAQAMAALDEERARLLEEVSRKADEEARLRAEREEEVERLSEELRAGAAEGARLRAAIGELARERDELAARARPAPPRARRARRREARARAGARGARAGAGAARLSAPCRAGCAGHRRCEPRAAPPRCKLHAGCSTNPPIATPCRGPTARRGAGEDVESAAGPADRAAAVRDRGAGGRDGLRTHIGVSAVQGVRDEGVAARLEDVLLRGRLHPVRAAPESRTRASRSRPTCSRTAGLLEVPIEQYENK